MYDFNELRERYSSFIYRGFEEEYEDGLLKVRFFYEIPDLESFTTRWEFPAPVDTKIKSPILNELLFSLGMVEGISYYKCACPRTYEIPFRSLTDEQKAWWEHLIWMGLGEFRYVNGIETEKKDLVWVTGADPALGYGTEKENFSDVSKPTGFPDQRSWAEGCLHDPDTYEGVMVPIGGGKDSVVSLEILKGNEITAYTVNCSEAEKRCIEACGHCRGHLNVRRILDKKILEMNAKGYLNGHIPFSAVLAFSAVVCAFLNGVKYIALSNENSANESTVRGSDVNHQYSKSFEFEMNFTEYLKGLTDSDIHYFSLLRPLSELQIAAVFAKHKKYHQVFRSCNRGSKQGIWCCDCPKCMFVYIILSPFLSDEELTGIFGENLLEKESMDQYFTELCGIAENKPFECVGTRAEVMACLGRFIKDGRTSLLTDRYGAFIKKNAPDIDELLREWNDENNVPELFQSAVKCETVRAGSVLFP